VASTRYKTAKNIKSRATGLQNCKVKPLFHTPAQTPVTVAQQHQDPVAVALLHNCGSRSSKDWLPWMSNTLETLLFMTSRPLSKNDEVGRNNDVIAIRNFNCCMTVAVNGGKVGALGMIHIGHIHIYD
jgi:hypothetical protein